LSFFGAVATNMMMFLPAENIGYPPSMRQRKALILPPAFLKRADLSHLRGWVKANRSTRPAFRKAAPAGAAQDTPCVKLSY
jgi:hypothetical protein